MKAIATTYEGLEYTTREINSRFKIKVSGVDENGKKLNTLVGVKGLIRLIGDIQLVNKMLKKAFAGMLDKFVQKLRRGVKISFYNY